MDMKKDALERLNETINTIVENTEGKTMKGLREATYQSFTAELKRCEKNFKFETLVKAAEYLEVEIDELFHYPRFNPFIANLIREEKLIQKALYLDRNSGIHPDVTIERVRKAIAEKRRVKYND